MIQRQFLILFSILLMMGVTQAQSDDITVEGQIYYADPGLKTLYPYDIATEAITPVFETDADSEIYILSHEVSPDGSQVAITTREGLFLYDVVARTAQTILTGDDTLWLYVKDWSADGTHLTGYSRRFSDERQYTVFMLDIATVSITPIFDFVRGSDFATLNFPYPEGVSNAILCCVRDVQWNPSYPDWIAVTISLCDQDRYGVSDEPLLIATSFVYNIRTNQHVRLDNLVEFPRFATGAFWTDAGNTLVIQSAEADNNFSQLVLMALFDADTGTIEFARDADSITGRISDAIGIDDIIVAPRNYQFGIDVMFRQLIASTLQEQLIRRIDSPTIAFGATLSVYIADENRDELSCLFDSALPSRLSARDTAIVAVESGLPLRVRDEPDLSQTMAFQLDNGTEVTIIGDTVCANAGDYVRFLLIETVSGQRGWAVEATDDLYFLAPSG